MRLEARRALLWKAGGAAAIGAVAALSVWSVVHSVRYSPPKKKAKQQISYCIARVVGKAPVRRDGKTKLVVRLSIGSSVAEKVVDKRAYESVQVGQEFRVSFDYDPETGRPRVLDWKPFKRLTEKDAKGTR